MTSTDRAFIAAFQQQTAAAPAGTSVEDPAPHFAAPATRSRRAPLSDHLAKRRGGSPSNPRSFVEETAIGASVTPGIEVEALPWPPLVERLVEQGRDALLDILARVSRQPKAGETPLLLFVGARPGVGATTALLATAKLVSNLGGRVAIVDAAPCASSAAGQLGVRRAADFDDAQLATQPNKIDDLLVAGRACRTSVFAASDGPVMAGLIETATARLTATHDLVLVDTGEADQVGPGVAALAAQADTLLVDAAAATPERRSCVAQLDVAGVAVTGVIESLAEPR